MSGLRVSPGGISQALARISHWLGVEKSVLLEAIRGSPQVHVDETGWRLNASGGVCKQEFTTSLEKIRPVVDGYAAVFERPNAFVEQ